MVSQAPRGFGQSGFFWRTHGTDQLHAERLGPLAGQGAHATGRSVEQDGLAALQFIGLAQQVLHGQALEHGTGGLFEADVVRQVHQVSGGQYVQLAVRAERAAAVGHAVADLELGDFAANRVNYAGAFCAQTGTARPVARIGRCGNRCR